jgi:hypothetical protein
MPGIIGRKMLVTWDDGTQTKCVIKFLTNGEIGLHEDGKTEPDTHPLRTIARLEEMPND